MLYEYAQLALELENSIVSCGSEGTLVNKKRKKHHSTAPLSGTGATARSSSSSGGGMTPAAAAASIQSSTSIRLIRAGQMRGRNLPLLSGGQRVMLSAAHVPEDLINQVQVRQYEKP